MQEYHDIITAIIAALSSSGIMGVIQFLITRHDQKKGKIHNIEKSIKKIFSVLDAHDEARLEDNANEARITIIQAGDELRRGIEHSLEWYTIIMDAIHEYENYCANHPRYKNDKATLAIKRIRDSYMEHMENNNFL